VFYSHADADERNSIRTLRPYPGAQSGGGTSNRLCRVSCGAAGLCGEESGRSNTASSLHPISVTSGVMSLGSGSGSGYSSEMGRGAIGA
jgi:hypothetical protein